ncbi:calcium-activated chloride channel-domain-containing protein [Stachybotrys elegans]|uniref:Calcium-activated chloride channel-domain-containing protein n=1 Tax=Stachybotrys elegans TaxID=80388 RepID=A0A8K0WXB6_9HYPO|nr:calcium-activated chloride channel-domain-containing protein [Stachybotrys elegans]
MSKLTDIYGKSEPGAEGGNFGVDYVINYQIPPNERAEAEASFVQLIQALTSVGIATEVRHGSSKDSLLVFIKVASSDLLVRQVYRARLQDWLSGVRTSSPDKNLSTTLQDEPISEAERLRLIYLMVTKPKDDGGAGITPGTGQWRFVKSVFPLHDHAFNKAWIQKWSGKYLLDQADLDEIRDKFGESVAFYFAFVRSYFRFLMVPAGVGLLAWMFLGQFSNIYALTSCLWSVIFFEYWKQQEVDLAVQWGVRGVSNIQHKRPEFEWEYEAEDPITGEPVKVYPWHKRLQTQLLQIPFALVCITVLGGLVLMCNSLEVFINEVYAGSGKQYLTFLPTILLVVLTPTFTGLLMKVAGFLNVRENYETTDAYNAALITKQFVLNFMTSYMPLLFTAFIYIPFGDILLPFLEFWHATAQTITMSEKPLPTREFKTNATRISNQMFYFTVTAQIVNLLTEVVVPYVRRQAIAKAKEFRQKSSVNDKDHPEEAEFLQRVRSESELEAYDVSGDYREMAVQFGYLSLFSVAWPLAACCFLVNNWVELRSDALKIAIGSRRPIPWRSDSIGPWLHALGFLSWLGSMTSSAIVFLCSNADTHTKGSLANVSGSTFLLGLFLAENFYLATQRIVRFVMSKLERPGLQKERKARFLVKKRLVEENLGQAVEEKAATPGIEASDRITREALEEEARRISTRGHGSPQELFWQRQRGMNETIEIGRRMIAQSAAEDDKASSGPSPSPRA